MNAQKETQSMSNTVSILGVEVSVVNMQTALAQRSIDESLKVNLGARFKRFEPQTGWP